MIRARKVSSRPSDALADRVRAAIACAVAAALLAGGAPLANAAGEGAGTAAGNFLSLGSGASSLAMAGATLASGHDLAAASWNVASLARLDALQFSLSHAPLPGGGAQDWLAAGGRLGAGGTRWGIESLLHREADLDGRDASDNPTGSFSVTDLAVGTRIAHDLWSFASGGVGVHWVHESLAGISGSGVSFDAGLRANAGPIGMAVAARHLGGTMRYPNATYDLPAVIATGLSWTDASRGIALNADYESPSHAYPSVRLGGEWLWRDRVAVRAGYRAALSAPSEARISGATFGLGTGVGAMWVDYSYMPEGDESAGEHRVGLTFRPGILAGERLDAARETGASQGLSPRPRAEAARPSRAEKAERQRAVATPPPATSVSPSPASSVPPAVPARSSSPTTTAPKAVSPPAVPAAPPTAAQAPASAPAAPSASPATQPPPAPMPIVRPTVVVVVPGETLALIARRWNISVAALMMANDLVNEQVVPGQRLKLPPAR